jgi:GAF domain-containing protein
MTKTKKPKEDHDEKMMKENIQKRFESMFTGEAQPLSNMSIQEVEGLKSRVADLEAQLAQQRFRVNQGPAQLIEARRQVETSKENHVTTEKPVVTEAWSKQIAVWIARIFIAVGMAFLGYSLYNLFVTQAGQADLSDRALIPLTFLMVIVGLFGLRLIQRDRPVLGGWMLYGMNVILPPVLATLFLAHLTVLLTGYLVVFSLVFINFVIPRISRGKAIVVAVVAALTIFAIELWNPSFRTESNHLSTITPVVGALALLSTFAFVLRQTMAGNIRTKLVVASVLISMLSVTIVAFLAQRSLSTNLTENIGTNLAKLASAKSLEVGQTIDRESDLLKALALNKNIQEAVSLEETNLLSQTEIASLDERWQTAHADDQNTDSLVSGVLYNSISSELRQFQEEFPQHVELFLTDRQGINIAATDRTSDYYQADEGWWQAAYQKGLYIAQPEYDESSKTISINMAVAIQDPQDGKVLGVLRTSVDFSTLAFSLIAGQFGQTGHTDIYLPNGQELTLTALEDGSHELVMRDAELNVDRLAQTTNPYAEVSHNGVTNLASQALLGVLSDTEEDTQVISDLNWRIVVLQNRAEALQPLTIQTRNIVVLVVLINIAVVIAALVLARLISNPIVRLRAVAEKIASGDLAVEAKVETNDEIGTLAATFNNMTSQLRSLVGSLERRVQDRTHDLELASEVGRTITEKVANASEMLTTAAELIRNRFELYYTQVYLIETSGQKLILHAGTGDVGEQLLVRGHQLLIDSGSLNGQAVLEKKPLIVADTRQSASFKPNPLLPKTRSEMVVPLILGGQVIGVLDMQSEQPDTFTETNLAAFEALAGQLAVALQNARLLAEAEEARSEVEAQIRRFTEQGWQDFLDAIEHGQRLGFTFDQNKVIRLKPESLSRTSKDQAVSIPIAITGTQVGEIQLPAENDRTWTQNEIDLIKTTSAQLAQHIDNLRLLAQADQYRAEAQQAVRRLTREGWDNYLQTYGEAEPGFVFDLTEVKALDEENNEAANPSIKHPMIVREEMIGEITVETPDDDDEASDILAAVGKQLSDHLENLRLSELNEKRAYREHTLRQITTALRSSTNPATIMRTAVREIGSILGRKTIVQLAEPAVGNKSELSSPADQS